MKVSDKIKKGLKNLTEAYNSTEDALEDKINTDVDTVKSTLGISEPEAKDWVAKMHEGDDMSEEAVSKSQQRFMGMVSQCQKTGDCPSDEVRKVAAAMSPEEVDKFASTKHDDLPEKIEEDPEDELASRGIEYDANPELGADYDEYQALINQELTEDESDGTDVAKLQKDVQKVLAKLDMGVIQMYLNKIDKPIEQAEMIAQFAEMIGVPRAKLSLIISSLKDIAKEPQGDESQTTLESENESDDEYAKGTDNNAYGIRGNRVMVHNMESVNPRMSKSDLIEVVTGKEQAKVIKRIKVKDIK